MPASDRKSTRLNSSHLVISYAVFCLKKDDRLAECAAKFVVSVDGVHAPADGPPASGVAKRCPGRGSLHHTARLRQSQVFFFLMIRLPPRFALFPYLTLFR